MIDIEYIRFICYKVRSVVSHIEVIVPEKPLTPKNIGEALNGPQRQ